MKKRWLWLIVIIFLFTGCGKGKIASISASEVYDYLDDGTYVILDVRRQYEYDAGHIKNAILLPVSDIASIVEMGYEKDQKIVVYCRTGHRSHEAAEKLNKLGYTNVYDLGGILDWPYEVVTE